MNELLLWLSARVSGPLRSFRARCAELVPESTGQRTPLHRLATWNLSKLGHAEFTNTTWRVAPPVLAVPDLYGTTRALLCGARLPCVIEPLTTFRGDVALTATAQPAGPDLIEVQAGSAAALAAAALAANLTVQWNAPLAILAAAVPVACAQLEPYPLPVGAGWTVSRFSKSGLAWVDSSLADAHAAKRALFRFRGEYTSTAYVLIEDGQPSLCDPSVGKFRLITRRHRPLAYSAITQELVIAAACRPPALVERALVVASGLLPAIRDKFLVYPRVAPATAHAAAAILGQRLY